MLLERIYDEDLSHASYLIGCQTTNQALVVDPRRDVTTYLDLARKNGMRIVAVAETHIHADYLSGTRELAAATGAEIYVSGEGGPDWTYGFDATLLRDGDTITLGNLSVQASHTPGHTPEHLSFLVTDGAVCDEPGYMLSGDFVFSGDLGRPDLLDEAAGGRDTRYEGARQIFRSLRETFLALPDHVQVYPAHGAGSACGKALGAVPSTTVGYERRFAWWGPFLAEDDEDGFVAELLDGQPDAPAYFGRMKRQNRDGPAVLGKRPHLPELATSDVARALERDEVTFVDTRPVRKVHRGTVTEALSLPNASKSAAHGGWALDPERDRRQLVLLARSQGEAEELSDHLARVGIDRVWGYVTTLDGLPRTTPQTVRPEHLENADAALLLDVRNAGEHTAGHIPGSRQLSAGRVLWHQDQLPEDGTIVTYCQTGVRSSVAASALRRAGHEVVELEGSYAAWTAWRDSLRAVGV